MVKRLGLPLVGVLVAAAVLVAGAGAIAQPPAHHAPDFTTRAGVVEYLKSKGIDPKGFVIQRGAHNYAGPSCPGVGWTCTTAKHVVQIMHPTNNPGNTNQFTCTPSSDTGPYDCLIVQSQTGTTPADNNATCVEKIGDPTDTQNCDIYQLNTSGGANNAYVQQQVSQTAVDTSVALTTTQTATQDTEIAQWATTGSNTVQVNQDLKESQSALLPKTASITQNQDGYQASNVTQHSDTGNNTAKVLQSLQLKASATGGTSITQNQDTAPGSPNTSASVFQNSDQDSGPITSSGTNNAYVFQSNDLNASGSKTGSLTQTQGSASSGIFAHTDQQSLGLSTGVVSQNEHQTLGDSQVGSLSQFQYGPEWYDPNQGGNTGDTLNVSQSSDQNGDPTATQIDDEEASCSSSGVCTITQKASNDKTSVTNSCTSTPTSPCDISITLVSPCGVECPPPTCSNDCTSVPFDTPPPVNICAQIPSAPPCAPVTTTTALVSSANPAGCGSTTLTATVSPSTATGSVQFSFGTNAPFATVPLSGGTASTIVSSPLNGTYTATYVPTGNYAGSSGSVSQTVQCIQ